MHFWTEGVAHHTCCTVYNFDTRDITKRVILIISVIEPTCA
jgi:hypothetical protein